MPPTKSPRTRKPTSPAVLAELAEQRTTLVDLYELGVTNAFIAWRIVECAHDLAVRVFTALERGDTATRSGAPVLPTPKETKGAVIAEFLLNPRVSLEEVQTKHGVSPTRCKLLLRDADVADAIDYMDRTATDEHTRTLVRRLKEIDPAKLRSGFSLMEVDEDGEMTEIEEFGEWHGYVPRPHESAEKATKRKAARAERERKRKREEEIQRTVLEITRETAPHLLVPQHLRAGYNLPSPRDARYSLPPPQDAPVSTLNAATPGPSTRGRDPRTEWLHPDNDRSQRPRHPGTPYERPYPPPQSYLPQPRPHVRPPPGYAPGPSRPPPPPYPLPGPSHGGAYPHAGPHYTGHRPEHVYPGPPPPPTYPSHHLHPPAHGHLPPSPHSNHPPSPFPHLPHHPPPPPQPHHPPPPHTPDLPLPPDCHAMGGAIVYWPPGVFDTLKRAPPTPT